MKKRERGAGGEKRTTEKRSRRGVWRILSWGAGIILVAALTVGIVFVALNYAEIQDYVAGMGYEPTAEMSRIRDELGLTERARLVFGAARPELKERGDFNRNCRASGEGGTAILGCYTDGKIYVYDIVSDELAGVKEASVAHELLHAVWERMSEGKREALEGELRRVLAEHSELEEELKIYDESDRVEELYARAGTEVRELPAVLEEHYATVFSDQDAVVAYYEKYISVFREIEEQLAKIEAEVETVKGELDGAVSDYERRLAQWSADVVSFNACAATEGCFRAESAFRSRRAQLINEQNNLLALYDEISGLVEKYNGLVEEYNNNLVHGQMLNDAVNSLATPEEIE